MSDTPPGLCQCGCGASTGVWAETHRPRGRVKGAPKPYIRGHERRGKPNVRRKHHERYQPRQCGCGCGAPTNKNHIGAYAEFLPGHYLRKAPEAYRIEDRGHGTPCWVWQLSVQRLGYGMIRRDGRMRLAHRVSYEDQNGKIPPGLDLDHLCRVPSCVNPDHLEAVSHAINMQRGRKTKLDADAVHEIRLMLTAGWTLKQIADRYGVHLSTIHAIKTGKSWSNVPA